MVGHSPLHAGSGILLPCAAGRVLIREKVELRPSEAEPRPVEDEVGRTRHFLEPQRTCVEAARALEVADDEPDVLDAHRHDRLP